MELSLTQPSVLSSPSHRLWGPIQTSPRMGWRVQAPGQDPTSGSVPVSSGPHVNRKIFLTCRILCLKGTELKEEDVLRRV